MPSNLASFPSTNALIVYCNLHNSSDLPELLAAFPVDRYLSSNLLYVTTESDDIMTTNFGQLLTRPLENLSAVAALPNVKYVPLTPDVALANVYPRKIRRSSLSSTRNTLQLR